MCELQAVTRERQAIRACSLAYEMPTRSNAPVISVAASLSRSFWIRWLVTEPT